MTKEITFDFVKIIIKIVLEMQKQANYYSFDNYEIDMSNGISLKLLNFKWNNYETDGDLIILPKQKWVYKVNEKTILVNINENKLFILLSETLENAQNVCAYFNNKE